MIGGEGYMESRDARALSGKKALLYRGRFEWGGGGIKAKQSTS
jgi:hypothetical protein